MTATGPEVFVIAITTFLSDYYDDLEETLTHMKSLKLRSYTGYNVTDFCASILVYAERLESDRTLKTDQLGYITRIFKDASDSRFRLWGI